MIISDKIYISVDLIKKYIVDICNLFTYSNPEYYIKKKQKLSVANISPSLYNFKFETINGSNHLVLPRGCYSRLVELLKDRNIFIRALDKRILKNSIDINLVDTELQSQQVIIIKTLLTNEGGLIEASPGGGKSISILGFISELKQPTLILVHESFLQDQWLIEIKNRLGGSFTVGRWDMRHKVRGDVDVGIVNTVQKQVDLDKTFLNHYGVIVLDECHRCPAPTFLKILNNSKSKYRIGITGTVERKDMMHIITYDVIGERLISIDAKDLKHRITSFKTDIVNLNLDVELPTTRRWNNKTRKKELVVDITNSITLLTNHERRNTIILNKIIEHIKLGYFPLVLSDRVAHVKYLDSHLRQLGYSTIMLVGSTKQKDKHDWEEIRKDQSIQCVVASTKKAEEGLDWPRLSAIHLTCPSSNLPKIKQRIGRIRRRCKDKKVPVVCDYIDNLAYYCEKDIEGNESPVYILRYGAKKRLKYYRKLQDDYDDSNSLY